MNQRLFQDAGGTTPAIIAGQPVGLIKRLAGSVDATQATALSKPTLARWPRTGVKNLASHAQDFSKWASSPSNNGISREKIWEGIMDGIPTVRYRHAGTATASGLQAAVYSNSSYAVPHPVGVTGTVYTLAFEARILAGVEQLPSTDGLRGDVTERVLQTTGGSSNNTGIRRPTEWTRLTVSKAVTSAETDNITISVGLRVSEGTVLSGFEFEIRGLQMWKDVEPSQLQYNYGQNDVTEPGVADLWHLYNDGGDSLNVTLPAGTYGLASIDINRAITIATITSDGTTPINTLRHERQLDVILRAGAFSAGEETAIRDYWGRVFA